MADVRAINVHPEIASALRAPLVEVGVDVEEAEDLPLAHERLLSLLASFSRVLRTYVRDVGGDATKWARPRSTVTEWSRASLAAAESSRFFINGRARPDEHYGQETARPAINDPVATDPRGPEAFEFAPQRLSNVGSVAKSVDHRPNLPALVRMGAADDGCRVKAERYFARRADRFVPRGFCPKTSS